MASVEASAAIVSSPAVEPRQSAEGRSAFLVRKYGGRAPRYTSYPTAVQFTPAVGAADYAGWLAGLRPQDGAVSLYLHIPFCDRMCWYCGCHTAVVNKRGPIEDYVGNLLREIDLVAAALPHRLSASAVHFGGGTPNMLAPSEFAAIVDALRARFDIAAQAEIAVELDPRLLTSDWVRTAAAAGMNRASLGAQDFQPDVQQAINRIQPYELVRAAAAELRKAGVVSLNLDLMYGLPRQTLASLEDTIDQAISLNPERLSLFGYAHVPWMKAHQKLIRESELPEAILRYDMQRRAAEILGARGWTRLGLDHFANPADSLARAAAEGRMRRNFQGYTTDNAPTLIGFGASAIGGLPQGYVQNATAVPKWREKIQAGELPVVRGVATTAEDRFRAEIIERLMCDLGVDLAGVCARHGRGVDELSCVWPRLDEMAGDGLLVRRGPVIEATPTGRDFIRSIATVFDAYLDAEAARHSLGV